MTYKIVRDYIEADVWLSLYAANISAGCFGIQKAAKMADIALHEFESRYVITEKCFDTQKRYITEKGYTMPYKNSNIYGGAKL